MTFFLGQKLSCNRTLTYILNAVIFFALFQVNWIPKAPKDLIKQGLLPDIKVRFILVLWPIFLNRRRMEGGRYANHHLCCVCVGGGGGGSGSGSGGCSHTFTSSLQAGKKFS